MIQRTIDTTASIDFLAHLNLTLCIVYLELQTLKDMFVDANRCFKNELGQIATNKDNLTLIVSPQCFHPYNTTKYFRISSIVNLTVAGHLGS